MRHWWIYKQQLYHEAKQNNLPVRWTSKVKLLEDIVVKHRSENSHVNKIVRAYDSFQLRKINAYETIQLRTNKLNRMLPKIKVPSDKYLWITLYNHNEKM